RDRAASRRPEAGHQEADGLEGRRRIRRVGRQLHGRRAVGSPSSNPFFHSLSSHFSTLFVLSILSPSQPRRRQTCRLTQDSQNVDRRRDGVALLAESHWTSNQQVTCVCLAGDGSPLVAI